MARIAAAVSSIERRVTSMVAHLLAGIEPARVLDLALHPLHVGIFALGVPLQQAQAIDPDLHQPLGIGDQADDQRPRRRLELGGRRHRRHQRHVGRAHAAIGEIDAGRRLRRARRPDQDHVGVLEIVRRLAVVVRQRVVHGVDAVEIAFVELMLAARPLLALGMEMQAEHAHRLVEHADAGQLQLPAAVAYEIAQIGIDQGVEHRPAIALDLLHHLFHLALGAHQRPDMLLHEDALVLHEAGARHARHGLAGRIGHEMDVEIAVRHGHQLTPQAASGEIRDWRRQSGDRRADLSRTGRFRTRLAFPVPRLRPLWMTWDERACESGIDAGRPEFGGLSSSTAGWGRESNQAHPRYPHPLLLLLPNDERVRGEA